MKSRKFTALLTALTMSLCAGTALAEPLKVAFVTPKSGPLAFIGAMYEPTIDFVQKPFNDAATNTAKIDIKVYDDAGTTQGAADRFKQAIADGARVFIGAGTSPLAAQNLADIQRWNQRNPDDPAMLLIVGSEGSNFIGSDCDFYSFHFTTTPFIRQNALAKVMKEEGLLGEKVYSLQPDYTMGREMEAAVEQNAEQYGYNVVGKARHDVFKIKDFSPFIEKARLSTPEIIFTASSGSDLRLILQAASTSGLKVLFASTFLDEPGNISAAGTSALNSYSAQLFNAQGSGETGDSYRNAFRTSTGRDPVAYMNNSVQTLEMLTKAVGSFAASDNIKINDLVKKLETTEIDWPHGKLSMRSDDHQLQLPIIITKVSKEARDKIDGTDMGFEPIRTLSAEETSLPVSEACNMKRPS
ncbi:ABC transporter substrate-binding protein [Brucellaceae bacterium C25G]